MDYTDGWKWCSYYFFLKYNLLSLEREITQGLVKKSTEVSFVFLGTNSKNSIVHGSITLQLLQLLRELILLGFL